MAKKTKERRRYGYEEADPRMMRLLRGDQKYSGAGAGAGAGGGGGDADDGGGAESDNGGGGGGGEAHTVDGGRPAAKKSRTEEDAAPEGGGGIANSTGSWQHYGNGRWNTFAEQASKWLDDAAANGTMDVEDRSGKKAKDDRRIRCVPEGARLDSKRWTFYIVKKKCFTDLKKLE